MVLEWYYNDITMVLLYMQKGTQGRKVKFWGNFNIEKVNFSGKKKIAERKSRNVWRSL